MAVLITAENVRLYWHLIVLGSLILGLLVFFFARFLWPGWLLGRHLKKAIAGVKAITSTQQTVDIERIGREAMTGRKLSHLWAKFAETLHPQTATDALGQERVVRWRATVPAETYFSVETLIAVELKTEYFKHQPGILTGIGIIGTFAGLLRGLSAFSVSSDPETVRASLDNLIHGVIEAFFVSASAIALAMITTFLEKSIVTRRVKQVEELCQLLDSLFDGGVGEEYLSRLVKASESSATQTAQLKDCLVSDLKELLAEFTRQQTAAIGASFHEITEKHVAAIADGSKAQVQTTEQSGDRIAQAISESLSDPIQRIAAAVKSTSDTNGDVVTRALNEALVAFSQKLEDTFGGQMGGLNQLLQSTTIAMQGAVARFDRLAENLNEAGKNAADTMSERLSTALEVMEVRQQALNASMSEFVGQLRDMVRSSQSENNLQLQQTLALIGDQMAAMTSQLQEQARRGAETQHQQHELFGREVFAALDNLSKQSEQVAHAQQTGQKRVSDQADRLIEQLGQKVQDLTAQTSIAVAAMQASVTGLREVTTETTRRLEGSADTLSSAADHFAKAGNSVNSVMQQASNVSDRMSATAVAFNNAASTVTNALSDYEKAGKTLMPMVAELKSIIEVAKQEASVSQSLVATLRQSAEYLQQAHSDVDGSFEKICDELAQAHEAFAKNVEATLKRGNTAYQSELKEAVDYLKTAIDELGEVAEKIPVRR